MNPEPTLSTCTNTEPSVSTLKNADVISGRGKVDHEGNSFFRQLVSDKLPEYRKFQSTGDRQGGLSVVKEIVEGVRAQGGRFMKLNYKNKWVEMSYKDSKDKADRACRDAARKMERKAKAEAVELTPEDLFEEPRRVQQQPPLLSPLSVTTYNGTYRDPELDYSCGSLFMETPTPHVQQRRASGVDFHATMEMSNLSLDFKSEDEKKTTEEEEEDEEEEVVSIELMAPMTRLADSCMSLDFLSVETPRSMDDASRMSGAYKEDSDATLRVKGASRNRNRTEELLLESFSKSMDLRKD